MKYIVITSLLLFPFLIFGQIKKETKYKNSDQILESYYVDSSNDEILVGKYIKFYENGDTNVVGYFKNNKKDSVWTIYYPNGIVGKIMNYNNDKLNGKYSDYFDNGEPYTKCEYKNGVKNGIFEEYFKNHLIKKGFYKNGLRDSLWVFYNLDFTKHSSGKFKNSLKTGEWKFFDKNKLESIVSFKNDLKDGPAIIFTEKADTIAKGLYKNDTAYTASWNYYHCDETINSECHFRGGDTELIKYLKNKMIKEIKRSEFGYSFKIFVKFTVGKDGSIKDVSIAKTFKKHPQKLLDLSMKIFYDMPRWIPEIRNGALVESVKVLPIKQTVY